MASDRSHSLQLQMLYDKQIANCGRIFLLFITEREKAAGPEMAEVQKVDSLHNFYWEQVRGFLVQNRVRIVLKPVSDSIRFPSVLKRKGKNGRHYFNLYPIPSHSLFSPCKTYPLSYPGITIELKAKFMYVCFHVCVISTVSITFFTFSLKMICMWQIATSVLIHIIFSSDPYDTENGF